MWQVRAVRADADGQFVAVAVGGDGDDIEEVAPKSRPSPRVPACCGSRTGTCGPAACAAEAMYSAFMWPTIKTASAQSRSCTTAVTEAVVVSRQIVVVSITSVTATLVVALPGPRDSTRTNDHATMLCFARVNWSRSSPHRTGNAGYGALATGAVGSAVALGALLVRSAVASMIDGVWAGGRDHRAWRAGTRRMANRPPPCGAGCSAPSRSIYAGNAPRVVVTGGVGESGIAEAAVMEAIAVAHGVPAAAMVLETRATRTPESAHIVGALTRAEPGGDR